MFLHFTFIKFMYVFFLLMFLFVFISDYKTWIPTFKTPSRTKKLREEMKEKGGNL